MLARLRPFMIALPVALGIYSAGYAQGSNGTITVSPGSPTLEPRNFNPYMLHVNSTILDLEYDSQKNLLYVATEDAILRFDLISKSSIAPIESIGHNANIALSPSSRSLAVGIPWPVSPGIGAVKLINLDSGISQSFEYNLITGSLIGTSESGPWDMEFVAENQLLTSGSSGASSGSIAPLRLLELDTGNSVILDWIGSRSDLSITADRSIAVFSDDTFRNGVNKPSVGTYDLSSGDLLREAAMHISFWNPPVAVNRTGEIIAHSGLGAVDLRDPNLGHIETIVPPISNLSSAGALVFSPVNDILYFSAGNGSQSWVFAYDTNSQTVIDTMGYFTSSGYNEQLLTSPDGRWLFATNGENTVAVYNTSSLVVAEPSSPQLFLVLFAFIFAIRHSQMSSQKAGICDADALRS